MRIGLGKILLRDPSVLLLDEVWFVLLIFLF